MFPRVDPFAVYVEAIHFSNSTNKQITKRIRKEFNFPPNSKFLQNFRRSSFLFYFFFPAAMYSSIIQSGAGG